MICTLYQVEEASFYSRLTVLLLMGIEFNQVYIVNQLKYSTWLGCVNFWRSSFRLMQLLPKFSSLSPGGCPCLPKAPDVLSHVPSYRFPVVQLLSHVQLISTQRTAAHQASLSITISLSLLKLIWVCEFVWWVSDDIQPSHPLSSPSPPALNLSQHQGLFQRVSSLHQVA